MRPRPERKRTWREKLSLWAAELRDSLRALRAYVGAKWGVAV